MTTDETLSDVIERNREPKHTPGPWTVLPDMPSGGGISIGPVLEGIGPHATVNFNGGESEANARLIALAPEMAEALEDCAEALEDAYHTINAPGHPHCQHLARVAVTARALLAKLGETS